VTQAIGAQHQVAKAFSADHAVMPYGHDLSAMAAQVKDNTRLIFIANPNNPTGTWLNVAELEQFIAAQRDDVIVVLDEAYYEYMPNDLKPDSNVWLKKYPNLIITRTFSKIFGLAGLRIGYAVSHPDVADLLNRVRQPFNTNLPAQAAALAALHDKQHLSNSIACNQVGLKKLTEGVAAQGLKAIPSIGNFISVDIGRDAAAIYEALLREGVIVRPLANYNLSQHLRFSIGTAEQNQRLLDALKKVLS